MKAQAMRAPLLETTLQIISQVELAAASALLRHPSVKRDLLDWQRLLVRCQNMDGGQGLFRFERCDLDNRDG